MLKLQPVLVAMFLFSSFPLAADESVKIEPSPSEQAIVVHLSHSTDDLHRCFMALKTANMLVGSLGLKAACLARLSMAGDIDGCERAEPSKKSLIDLTIRIEFEAGQSGSAVRTIPVQFLPLFADER